MSAHSFLPPSGAKAWRVCAAWPSMNQRYPQEDSEDSLAGTAAHWVAWKLYCNHSVHEGMEASNGVIVTSEMIEGAEMLLEVMRQYNRDWRIEYTILIPAIHQDCFGTPDVWGYDPATKTLHVIDYKFGHRFVDEYENEQIVAYVAGILDIIEGLHGHFDQDITVNATIVQPRCYYKGQPVRTWTFNAADIRGLVNDLQRAANAAYDPELTAITNSECGDCPGRHACAVYQKAIYSDMEMSGRSVPFDLPPQAASLELAMLERAMERMEGRVTGLRQVVESNLKNGQPAPWHTLVPSYGRPKWVLPDDQIVAVGQLYGKDLSKPGVVTPNQAVKLGIDEAVIKEYSTTPSGGMKLVPFDPKNISRIFKL